MGIILHEFLLGSIPFDGDTVNELFKTVLFGNIVWECDHAPPLDAQNLITELLRRNPLHRLGTDHSHINKHLVSEDEEGTSENNDGFDFENYTSSSEKHCKLCTTTTSMVNVEDPKTHPECTAASNSDIAEMQKESVSVSDRDDAITILPFSPSLSGSISRRILSSCRRGLSRDARVFASCHCCPRTI
ncbi:microtubule-associated serine/threonine-protein kinase 3-like isoform X2 [Ranitomeya imitator]|uniref:microtubule-associated serine/threonine-protein kinase 3-like isoform X2 n=1 Tax=Ranitomeya imitator TaxID=111125 RepID=UPI0037E81FD4